MLSSEADVAWACGLFEGEGSVYVNVKREHGGCVKATIGMTDLEPLQAFCRIVGMGKVDGPFQPKNPKCKLFWRWRLGNHANVEKLYLLFKERLSPRRCKQFEKALASTRGVNHLISEPTCGIGTYSAYTRHRKRGEPPCEACRKAQLVYMREWRNKNREEYNAKCREYQKRRAHIGQGIEHAEPRG